MPQLDLIVNGEPLSLPGPATLADLLRHLELDARMVVVEHNGHIVRRPHLAEVMLATGDSAELVHFVGGG